MDHPGAGQRHVARGFRPLLAPGVGDDLDDHRGAGPQRVGIRPAQRQEGAAAGADVEEGGGGDAVDLLDPGQRHRASQAGPGQALGGQVGQAAVDHHAGQQHAVRRGDLDRLHQR
jgi:hypothetical protein